MWNKLKCVELALMVEILWLNIFFWTQITTRDLMGIFYVQQLSLQKSLIDFFVLVYLLNIFYIKRVAVLLFNFCLKVRKNKVFPLEVEFRMLVDKITIR